MVVPVQETGQCGASGGFAGAGLSVSPLVEQDAVEALDVAPVHNLRGQYSGGTGQVSERTGGAGVMHTDSSEPLM